MAVAVHRLQRHAREQRCEPLHRAVRQLEELGGGIGRDDARLRQFVDEAGGGGLRRIGQPVRGDAAGHGDVQAPYQRADAQPVFVAVGVEVAPVALGVHREVELLLGASAGRGHRVQRLAVGIGQRRHHGQLRGGTPGHQAMLLRDRLPRPASRPVELGDVLPAVLAAEPVHAVDVAGVAGQRPVHRRRDDRFDGLHGHVGSEQIEAHDAAAPGSRVLR